MQNRGMDVPEHGRQIGKNSRRRIASRETPRRIAVAIQNTGDPGSALARIIGVPPPHQSSSRNGKR